MQSDPISHEDAVALKEEICALDGVKSLFHGQFGEIAVLFPGGRVRGLQLEKQADGSPDHLVINVIAQAGDPLTTMPPLEKLAASVRTVAMSHVDTTLTPVDVRICDIAV